jgi:hypothetical protein
MTVRAKVLLVESTDQAWNAGQKRLKFQCVYDSSIPEDQRFQEATPSGTAEFWIDNPAALTQFKLGENYYIDFTSVPKPSVE